MTKAKTKTKAETEARIAAVRSEFTDEERAVRVARSDGRLAPPATPKVGDELWFFRRHYEEPDQIVCCRVERVEVDAADKVMLSLAMSRRSACWTGVRLPFPSSVLFTSFSDIATAITDSAEERITKAKSALAAARKNLSEIEAEVDAWVGSTLRNGGAK
jgi:hypothetical protein